MGNRKKKSDKLVTRVYKRRKRRVYVCGPEKCDEIIEVPEVWISNVIRCWCGETVHDPSCLDEKHKKLKEESENIDENI